MPIDPKYCQNGRHFNELEAKKQAEHIAKFIAKKGLIKNEASSH
jgi:hypothetical protein